MCFVFLKAPICIIFSHGERRESSGSGRGRSHCQGLSAIEAGSCCCRLAKKRDQHHRCQISELDAVFWVLNGQKKKKQSHTAGKAFFSAPDWIPTWFSSTPIAPIVGLGCWRQVKEIRSQSNQLALALDCMWYQTCCATLFFLHGSDTFNWDCWGKDNRTFYKLWN